METKNQNSKSANSKFLRRYGLDLLVGVLLALLCTFLLSFKANAQNVGINNPAPHSKALLDLTSTDKGLLIPRVTLAARTAMFPAPDATAKGMMVYQTDAVTGFYFFDGTAWQQVGTSSAGWDKNGNSGTNSANNFIGTVDTQDVVIRANNVEGARFTKTKKFGLGTNNPGSMFSSARMEIADEDGWNSDFVMRVAGGGYPDFSFMKQTGTLNAPAAVGAETANGAVSGFAYDGTKYMLATRITLAVDSVATTNDVAGSIRFYTGNNNVMTEGMRVASNGNVGIGGIYTPVKKLDVNGDINFSNISSIYQGNIKLLHDSGTQNIFLGKYTAQALQNGTNLVAVGYMAGNGVTSASNNTFVGSYAGIANSTGVNNAYVGTAAGQDAKGYWNTYMGAFAGANDSIGHDNAFFGGNAGRKNKTGFNNCFMGGGAGYNNNSGSENCFLGMESGPNNTTGSSNAFVGHRSGLFNNGSNNTFIGDSAGWNNTGGNKNICIGYKSWFGTTVSNAMAIGANAMANVSNSCVLGDTSVNVGIGFSDPIYPLHFQPKLGNKISLWGNAGAHYGMGIQPWQMQFYVPNNSADFLFGVGSSWAFSEKMRIKGNGKVGLGTSTPGAFYAYTAFEIADSTGSNKDLMLRSSNNISHSNLLFARTRGSHSTPAAVITNEDLGRVSFMAYDGAALMTSAEIQAHIDSVPGTNSVPGNLTFHTTSPNQGSATAERMRIDRNGNVAIGTNAPSTRLEVEGGLTLGDDASITANAVITTLTVGNRSYFRINSTAVPTSRVMVLSDGLETGQILIIECAAVGTSGIRIVDSAATNNTNTVMNRDMLSGDVITMIWNGTDWLEKSYSDN